MRTLCPLARTRRRPRPERSRLRRRLFLMASLPLVALTVLVVLFDPPTTAGAPNAAPGGASAARAPRPPATGGEAVPVAWSWAAPGGANVGMPAVDGHHIAFTYGHVAVVLLHADGSERWQATDLFVRDVAPRLTAGRVLVATDDGVAAFGRDDGRLLWHNEAVGWRPSTPVVAAGAAIVTTWDGQIVGLDLGDGSERWRHALGGASLGPPAARGTLVVAAWDAGLFDGGGVTAFDAGSGAERWAAPVFGGAVSGPEVVEQGGQEPSVVVVVAGDQSAHGFDGATGTVRWSVPVGSSGTGEVPPRALGSGLVAAVGRMGHRAVIDARDGRRLWWDTPAGVNLRGGPVGEASPTWVAVPTDDGRVVVGSPAGGVDIDFPGRVSGLELVRAAGGSRLLLVASRGAPRNELFAVDLDEALDGALG